MRRDIPPANDFNHSDAEGDDESDYEGQGYSIEEAFGNGSTTASTGAKKARGQRSQTTRGPTALPAYRGTGFEEYFADPPMTPAEAEQEREEIYSERIENCINRYRSRRRLQTEHSRYLNEYLFLGGIDTSPAQFRGRDPKALKELTPAQRRQAMSHDVAKSVGDRFYDGDKERWVVDFTGVAAGFFSNPLLELTGAEPVMLDKAARVVENFLRYVLQHDVCPEYEDDVKNALQLCLDARSEWAAVDLLQRKLPGNFNHAAFNSFCVDEIDEEESGEDKIDQETLDNAKVDFLSSLALLEDDALFAQHSTGHPKEVYSFFCDVEVVSIHRPEECFVKRFELLCINDSSLGLNPIGSATFVPTTIGSDLVNPPMPRPFPEDQMILYFDDALLALMKPGMKLKLNVGELNTGFRYIRMAGTVYPSFWTFLPQELMKHFKPPRLSERPAPSIHTLHQDTEEGSEE
ncbi:unnamed protein product [Clonostachys chloroleuca]|uniref:Argonaute complex, subunit Arb1 n=1 Tax=Clonostachys chloroleuca TaxID=1926264 RepID=A0AA35PV07_9HYPO|nr:unnamed protein product [Clonostachys chloroleuca]